MTDWTAQELDELAEANQIRVAGRRKDGSIRTLTIVWQVIVDGVLYLRSVRGTEGGWYKGVAYHFEGAIEWGDTTREVRFTPDASHDEEIGAEYARKYGNGEATRRITSPEARATTLRVDPR